MTEADGDEEDAGKGRWGLAKACLGEGIVQTQRIVALVLES